MPLKLNTKKDDVLVFTQDFAATLIPVHGSSNGTAKDNLEKILSSAESGDIISGDFNINFLEPSNIKELVAYLNTKQFRIDIAEEVVKSLQPWFKMRSVNSLYSQQLLKNGIPDIFIKDLSFKLLKKSNSEEPSIPSYLQDKLNDLQQLRQQLLIKLEQLKENNQFNETSVSLLCTQLGIISYHNLQQSFGNDHPYTYYYDNSTNTVFFSQNSVQHTAYDFKNHFKDGINVDIEHLKTLYTNLDNLVCTEMYCLLAIRDNITINKEDIHQLNNQEKIAFIKEHLKFNRTNSNTATAITLSKENIANYFNTILRSQELSAINALLKKPFNLADENFILEQLKLLLSDKNLTSYAGALDKIINAIYQGLNPERPKKDEQSIALNGTGFLPFRNIANELIPLEEIEQKQIDYQIEAMNQLHSQYPNATFVVTMIEAKGQEHKCELIKNAVEKINAEVNNESAAYKTSLKQVKSLSVFNKKSSPSEQQTTQSQFVLN
ncbi:hypothetical protein ACNVED_04990 [Legionella sp. D16C41]|uniref:hypothetical protein n=1 Tax=Legionella sp. D16C41 TaxID=3402688 RepID=UPI003AF57F51